MTCYDRFMPNRRKAHRLAILVYDGFPPFEFAIAYELFVRTSPGPGLPWYDTRIISGEATTCRGLGGLTISAEKGPRALAWADTIIIPGWRDVSAKPPPALLAALRRAHTRGCRLLSICTGAFVLGYAGLLNGKRATTHWLYMDKFRVGFPQVAIESDVLYVDEGSIITSAGNAAGMDACMHMIRSDHGAAVANTIARRVVMQPHREGGQAQYVEAPLMLRPGKTMGEVIDWARANLHRPLTVDDLARRAVMSRRTFIRKFEAAVSMPPKAWFNKERINRAKLLLESTLAPLAAIAEQTGFISPDTFRLAFRRTVGVAPATYRRRFGSLERQ